MEQGNSKAVEEPEFIGLNNRMERALDELNKIEGFIRSKVDGISSFPEKKVDGISPLSEAKPSFALGHLRHNISTLENINNRLSDIYGHLAKIV